MFYIVIVLVLASFVVTFIRQTKYQDDMKLRRILWILSLILLLIAFLIVFFL